jgi:hypothetical protein
MGLGIESNNNTEVMVAYPGFLSLQEQGMKCVVIIDDSLIIIRLFLHQTTSIDIYFTSSFVYVNLLAFMIMNSTVSWSHYMCGLFVMEL